MGYKTSLIANTKADITIKEVRGQNKGHKTYWGPDVELKAGETWKVGARKYREQIYHTGEVSGVEIHCRGEYTGIKFWPADFIKYKAITISEKEILPDPNSTEGVKYEYAFEGAERGNNWWCPFF